VSAFMKTLRHTLGDTLTPAARAWIRFAPMSIGKAWLWETFHWRKRVFDCRTRFGSRITGDTEDLIQRYLYFFGTWEPNISTWLAATLKADDGFIDVGANIGHHSLLASGIVGDGGIVVAIEAAQWIHAILDEHVALNRRHNIRSVHVAAAAEHGVVRLYPGHSGNIGKTSTISREGPSVQVTAMPLTEILRDDEVRRARVIKIDVEGAELQVLRGLVQLLPRLRHDLEIIMEISPEAGEDAETSYGEIFITLQDHGFKAYQFDNDYGVESYLHPRPVKAPFRLEEFALTTQVDVLFSKM